MPAAPPPDNDMQGVRPGETRARRRLHSELEVSEESARCRTGSSPESSEAASPAGRRGARARVRNRRRRGDRSCPPPVALINGV